MTPVLWIVSYFAACLVLGFTVAAVGSLPPDERG